MSEKEIYEVRLFPGEEDRYEDCIKNNIIVIGWTVVDDLTDMNIERIKEKLKYHFDKYPKIRITQTANMLDRFRKIKKDDIILIPYKDKTVTIASVIKPYIYNKNFENKDMAHQIGIKIEKKVNLSSLSESLQNTLKARLTLTKISRDKHAEVFGIIEEKKYGKTTLAYRENMKFIHNTFINTENELIKKSLLFSAFSLYESYLTDLLKRKISLSYKGGCLWDSTNNNIVEILGKDAILSSLEKDNGRRRIFNLIFNEKLQFPTNEQQNLRNSLAHDITSPSIQDDIIYFSNKKKDTPAEEIIPNIFKEFISYPDKLLKMNKDLKNY
ncbi:hypothetical protein [Candidatus Enterococcus lemimoniae]|uniref:Uncharacterized protein n=1 Tax=Candidatus Enterococcus lemimoniae TaxID=1834167 RepID=A0ABZ2T0N9_9ENTE